MVMERESLFNLSPEERNIAEKFIQNNLRRSGEEDRVVTIGSLDFMTGFKVNDLTGREWEMRIKSKDGQISVRSPNPKWGTPGEREFEHHLFGPGRLVKVPKEIM